MSLTAPPALADTVLRALLAHRDRETVSGDLIEQYHDSILPMRGAWRANVWYLKQAAGFAWRGNAMWATLLSVTILVRTALDWLLPPPSFETRAQFSTFLVAGILLCAGIAAAWRTRSVLGGLLGGLTTTVIAAAVNAAGTAALLAVWHDQATWTAIQRSGGLAEAFVLPVFLIVAGITSGAVSGLALTRRGA